MSSSLQREEVVDFLSMPFIISTIAAIYKVPSTEDSSVSVFFKPFNTKVWACLGASVGLAALALWLVQMPSQHHLWQCRRLLGPIWMALGPLLNQCRCFLNMHLNKCIKRNMKNIKEYSVIF